ncbi:MAG: diguanylate cyclase, partial [Phycisphaeraceae bacterium]
TKILKTVNSSFYGQAHAVSSVSHALVVLGLNSVKTLALGFSLVNNLKDADGDGFDHFRFWKRSLYSATAAKSLANQMGLVQQEEAFLGGLLQDLGMLALEQVLPDEYAQVVAEAGDDHAHLCELEREHLGMEHPALGAALAEHWRLPPLLVAPIRHHEQPEEADGPTAPLVRAVAAGNRVADLFTGDSPGEALEGYYESLQRLCALDKGAANQLLHTIHKQTKEMQRLFELPTGELEHPDAILARANEALMQISLQQQQQSSELEQQNRQLVEQVYIDSLTGTANRCKFNTFVADSFEQAVQQDAELSILFMDVDHFKQFNDRHGHPTGDRVLIEVAALLKRCTPEPGLVCRYGGEEFSVVLPGTSRRDAAVLAERIRGELEQQTVESDEGEMLSVTASIGVATYEDVFFERVEQLIKAADQGMYAAKKAGRNCVRIFTPRRRERMSAA